MTWLQIGGHLPFHCPVSFRSCIVWTPQPGNETLEAQLVNITGLGIFWRRTWSPVRNEFCITVHYTHTHIPPAPKNKSQKLPGTPVVKWLSCIWLFAIPWIAACQVPLCPWDSPSKNTGVGCHFRLQGVVLTQGLNQGLLHCRQTSYCLSHGGSWK